jgi:DNA polymerase-1
MNDRPVLICDLANTFIRSYAAYPALGANGQQMGGVVGTLKTLSRVVGEVNPVQVFIAWEGGGSTKRRAIFKEYKLGRRPEKLNRFYDEEDMPDSDENKKHQMLVLLQLLKYVPVYQLYAADCEGDDIIAYLCRGRFRDSNKVIMSSDKDMYQLLDDHTKNYNLHRKTYVTMNDVFKEYRITSRNFAIAKSICGDPSDNIPGVKGLGFKTLVKHIPFIGLEKDILLDEIFDYCHANEKDSKFLTRILQMKDDIKRNYRLIYLDNSTLNHEQENKINYILDNFHPKSNRIEFMKKLASEGIGEFDTASFYYNFNCIERHDS